MTPGPPPVPRARVLIVEDEAIVAEDVRQRVTRAGHAVVAVVASAAGALAAAAHERADLALMDMRLKGETNGIDAALALRERYGVPVVFLTAHSDADTLARAQVAEPLGYIVKPFLDGEVEATLEAALVRAALRCQQRDPEGRAPSSADPTPEADPRS